MKLKRFKVWSKNFLSPLTVDASMKFKENRLDIRSGYISAEQSRVKFSGSCLLGNVPSLQLNLFGERLNIDEFLPAQQKEGLSLIDRLNESEFFANGESEVRFALDKFNYKLFNLDQIAGSIVVNNGEIEKARSHALIAQNINTDHEAPIELLKKINASIID